MSAVPDQLSLNEGRFLEALTAVSVAYFSKNAVAVDEISTVLRSIREGLLSVEKHSHDVGTAEDVKVPAAGQGARFPIEGSVTEDKIRCLKCGKWFQELKRHLHEKHGMDPLSYRVDVGLAPGVPLVAPSTSAKRREASLRRGGTSTAGAQAALEVVEQTNGDILVKDAVGNERHVAKAEYEDQMIAYDSMMPEGHRSPEGAREAFAIGALYEDALAKKLGLA